MFEICYCYFTMRTLFLMKNSFYSWPWPVREFSSARFQEFLYSIKKNGENILYENYENFKMKPSFTPFL